MLELITASTTATPAERPAATLDDVAREGSAWNDVRIWDYLHILLHRRWTVVAVLAFTVLSSLIMSFSSTPMYSATALLQIEPEGPNRGPSSRPGRSSRSSRSEITP